jgi:pyruvate formate lyase activating enzyme
MDEVRRALRSVPVEKVNFMGGEPTVATELPEALAFCKQELGVRTFLGHTIGLHLPLPNLDGANVGLKAWDDDVHRRYTGRERKLFFDNFAAAYRAGLEMRANIVFIPGFVDLDQVEAVAAWIASLNRSIPFHIMGYIPVPGQPYPRPTVAQMEQAVTVCRPYLDHVGASHLTVEEALNLVPRDDRFDVRQIA